MGKVWFLDLLGRERGRMIWNEWDFLFEAGNFGLVGSRRACFLTPENENMTRPCHPNFPQESRKGICTTISMLKKLSINKSGEQIMWAVFKTLVGLFDVEDELLPNYIVIIWKASI